MVKDEELRATDGEKQRNGPTLPGCQIRLIVPPVSRALMAISCGGAGLFFPSWSDPAQRGRSLLEALALVSQPVHCGE